ncbi:hypothetical protein [Nocardia sp. NPDC049149]|uniref:hypothetical protein n=1 Tax=Nocardia sp. NPDC049149 TaxID=3364315 RepID=UPI00371DFD6F
MAEFDNVTAWSARRRHLAKPGEHYTLCARATVVRPGDRYVNASRVPMTQELIDAMFLCDGCARVAAKAGTE